MFPGCSGPFLIMYTMQGFNAWVFRLLVIIPRKLVVNDYLYAGIGKASGR